MEPQYWDHPRLRGENLPGAGADDNFRGSSPLTRGKLRMHLWSMDVIRIIPAYAGKTGRRLQPLPLTQDHPRLRGENVPPGCHLRGQRGIIPAYAGKTTSASSGRMPRRGSSPLTRGKLLFRDPHLCHIRIIPAYAGKTYLLRISLNCL